jgi:hypothetical protein
VPDWLLTLPRLAWGPVRWAIGFFRRRTLAQHSLVEEGSEAVTPVIDFAKSLGPESIMVGSNDYIAGELKKKYERWNELRGPLLTYENHHPSDRIRELTKDAAEAVALDLSRTTYLFQTRPTATTMSAYEESSALQRNPQVNDLTRLPRGTRSGTSPNGST